MPKRLKKLSKPEESKQVQEHFADYDNIVGTKIIPLTEAPSDPTGKLAKA